MSGRMSALKEDKRAYSGSRIALGNLGILLWVVLGAVAIWFLYPVGAWIFAFIALIVVYGVVRKQLCKTCVYCKTCTMGFGKLPELVFAKAELGGVSPYTLLTLLVIAYILLTVIPSIFLAISISQGYAVSKSVVMPGLWLILFCSIAAKRKREK
jgi:hypothetical protein